MKAVWQIMALVMGLSLMCSCDKDKDEETTPVVGVPSIGGKYLTGLKCVGSMDEFRLESDIYYNGNLLDRIERGGAEYKVSYNPFTATANYVDDGVNCSEVYTCTFGGNGLIKDYTSTVTRKKGAVENVDTWVANIEYNDNDQISKMVASEIVYEGTQLLSHSAGEAEMVYNGKTLMTMKAKASGKEMNEEGEMVAFENNNIFTMDYGKNPQANKCFQFTPFTASFVSPGDGVHGILTMLGLAGKFSDLMPQYMHLHFEYIEGGEKGTDDDTATFYTTYNADGTIHGADGYTYNYSPTTRAEIHAEGKPAQPVHALNIFRHRK